MPHLRLVGNAINLVIVYAGMGISLKNLQGQIFLVALSAQLVLVLLVLFLAWCKSLIAFA